MGVGDEERWGRGLKRGGTAENVGRSTVDGGAREREDSVCGGWGHGAKDTWERERVCECGRGGWGIGR